MTQYTDKEAIEKYLVKTIDDGFDDQLDEWIEAMSIQADQMANRPLYRDEEETYLYDGDGTDMIIIGDACLITEVTVNDETVEVFKYPSNKPYASRIRRDEGYRFTKGIQNVAVTGIQAMHSELPPNIKLAVTILVSGIINSQIFGMKGGTTEKIGNYQVTYEDSQQEKDFTNAMKILSSYRRIALG